MAEREVGRLVALPRAMSVGPKPDTLYHIPYTPWSRGTAITQDWEHKGNWIVPQGFDDPAPDAAPDPAAKSQARADEEDAERLCVVRLLLRPSSPPYC